MAMAESELTAQPQLAVATVDDQRQTIALLSTPSTYDPGVDEVRRTDTHSAVVFLAGDRVYNLKRAVRYDYLDFSTLESRVVKGHGWRQAGHGVSAGCGGAGPACPAGGVALPRDWPSGSGTASAPPGHAGTLGAS